MIKNGLCDFSFFVEKLLGFKTCNVTALNSKLYASRSYDILYV